MSATTDTPALSDEELHAKYSILTRDEEYAGEFVHRTDDGICVFTDLFPGVVGEPDYPPRLSIGISSGGERGEGGCGGSTPLAPNAARELAATLIRAADILDAHTL